MCAAAAAVDTHECSVDMDGWFHVCFYDVASQRLFMKIVVYTLDSYIVIHPLRLKVSDQMIFIIICITFIEFLKYHG